MKDQLIKQISKGFDLLSSEYEYRQSDILRKFQTLNITTNAASFSNVLKGKGAGDIALKRLSKGILFLLEEELGMEYDLTKKTFVRMDLPDDWRPNLIPLADKRGNKNTTGYTYYDKGRLTVPEKVEFIKNAQKEVIEVGVRLNAFCSYFQTKSDHVFKSHITDLLKKGVNVKLYMLDPDSNEASFYFRDRAIVQSSEEKSIEVMKDVVKQLREIALQYEEMKLDGKFEVYFYKHLPYNHFLIVDGATRQAKMLASHYLYGIKRSNCPVVGIVKEQNRALYNHYWQSFKFLTEGAKKLSLE